MVFGLLFSAMFCLAIFAGQQGAIYIGPTTAENPKWATRAMFDGSLIFCRGYYEGDRYEPNGSGWWTDYPGADNNLLTRLSELTEIQVRFDLEHREPVYAVVELDSPLLNRCPVLFLSDVGTMLLTQDEVMGLRQYLDRGGFIWADDFWGAHAWDQWEEQIRRVLPAYRYPMVDITNRHPIMNMLYHVDAVPQMPNIGLWRDSNGAETSERGPDSEDVQFRGIQDERERLIVVATHNTDVADGWEEEGRPEFQDYFDRFAAVSYAIGANIYLYALSH